MSMEPDSSSAARGWIERAEQDLKNAEYTLTLATDCPFETVCFHAQQVAEKYFKALFAYRNIEFPKSHDPEVLYGMLSDHKDWPLDLPALVLLSAYAITGRYPGE